jgi:hypothetical protein
LGGKVDACGIAELCPPGTQKRCRRCTEPRPPDALMLQQRRLPHLLKYDFQDSKIGQQNLVDAFLKLLGITEKASPARKRLAKRRQPPPPPEAAGASRG